MAGGDILYIYAASSENREITDNHREREVTRPRLTLNNKPRRYNHTILAPPSTFVAPSAPPPPRSFLRSNEAESVFPARNNPSSNFGYPETTDRLIPLLASTSASSEAEWIKKKRKREKGRKYDKTSLPTFPPPYAYIREGRREEEKKKKKEPERGQPSCG